MPAQITGVILAGGLARRMGGLDKGLQLLQGRPLVQWAIERLRPQVEELLINANQNVETYAAFGHPVIIDAVGGFAGPLAGLHRAMQIARYPLVATVPCDSPQLPVDLVVRLQDALQRTGAQVAVAVCGGRRQPVFSLSRRELVSDLETFLGEGGRKIDDWFSRLHTVEVPFASAQAFANINTIAALSDFEVLVTSTPRD